MAKARKPKSCKVTYDFHPLASNYQLLEGEHRAELRKSLEAIGCQNPAVIYDEMILDGRNRWDICQELGIECPVIEYEGDEPELFVEAMNGHRRHLTDNARLLASVALAQAREKRIKAAENGSLQNLQANRQANQHGARTLPESEVERIAEETGVSERTVRAAAKVDESCAIGVKEAVRAGEVAVSDAAAVADLPKLDQAAALRAVKKGEAKTLRQAAGLVPDKSDAKGEAKDDTPKHLKDGLGKPVPAKLLPAFEKSQEVGSLVRELQSIKSRAESLSETIGYHLHFQSFAADIDNAKRALKFATPYTVCGYCKARDSKQAECKACHGCGWLPKNKFNAQPAENKQ